MFKAVQLAKPSWVIAENVGGLVTWNEGMVLEQVCVDLETEGYEVQPFIIPACAKNAPHRRDRAWIVANRKGINGKRIQRKRVKAERSKGKNRNENWNQNWIEVATELCQLDDGFSDRLVRFGDGYKNQSWWRQQALRALGNAIVPQIAIEIMQAIKRSKHEEKNKKS